jgi:hypothetical protein
MSVHFLFVFCIISRYSPDANRKTHSKVVYISGSEKVPTALLSILTRRKRKNIMRDYVDVNRNVNDNRLTVTCSLALYHM